MAGRAPSPPPGARPPADPAVSVPPPRPPTLRQSLAPPLPTSPGPLEATRFLFGPYGLDVRTHRLMRDGEEVPLSPKVFAVLKTLLTHHDRVVTKEELREAAWPRTVVSEGAIVQMMLEVRRLLGGDGAQEAWIVSVRGVGYRFTGPVRVEYGPSAPSPGSGQPAPKARTLYEEAFKHWCLSDRAGMLESVAALRDSTRGGGDAVSKVRATLLECALDRQAGRMDDAWQKLEAAELACSRGGLEVVAAQLHVSRGLMLVQFASPVEALPQFQRAWEHAQTHGDLAEMADCAFLLAASFGRSYIVPAFEEWADITLTLGAQSGLPWLWQTHAVNLAGTWSGLGEYAEQSGDMARARRMWGRSRDLLEQALPLDAETEPGLGNIARINLAWVRGYLSEQERPVTRALFAEMLHTEQRPQLRTALYLGQAEMLIRDGAASEALQCCRQGLEVVQATQVTRHLNGLLRVGADAATAIGEHAQAAAYLRRMIKLRDERRDAEATQTGTVIAQRLRTERALALAEAERERARALAMDNELLRGQLRLREAEPPAGG